MTASLTDTLNCNWDYAYANEFPVAVGDHDVHKVRTTAHDAIDLYEGGGGIIWLEGFLGFEPRMVMSKVRLAAKVRYLGEVIRAVLRLCVL